MKNTNVKTSWILLGIFAAQIVLPFGGVISRAYGYDNSYCDAFCGQIMNPTTHQVMNLAGTGTWSSTDASTCSAWSSSEYNPSALPTPLPSPWPSTSAQQAQCQWAGNNQATSQCLAYEAVAGVGTADKIIGLLDIAASALCALPCAAPGTAAALAVEPACQYAAITAGAVELATTMAQKSSAVSKALDGVLAAAGIAGGVMDLGLGGAGSFNLSPQALACLMFGTGEIRGFLRLKAFGEQQNTQQNACNAIQSLSSGANTAGTNPASLYPNGVPTMSGVSAPGTGSSGSGGNSAQVGVSCAQQGMGNQAGGCGLSSEQLSTGDGAAMNAGLGQAAAPQAMAMAPGILKALASGSDPAAAAGSALSGAAGGGPVGDALTNLASTVAAHAAELGAQGGAVAKDGGAGTPATAKAFNFDFGGGGGAAAGAPSDMAFDGARQPAASGGSGDIFHTGDKRSLFDIVGSTISKNVKQVEQLPYSTHLNCALTGTCVKGK